MRVYGFKNGLTFTAPSMFFNVQHSTDARAAVSANATANGLQNIDGVLIDVADYAYVSDELGFNTQRLMMPSKADLSDKIRLIDPSLHGLLGGNDEQKQRMLATGLLDDKIKAPIKRLMQDEIPNKDKPSFVRDEVYRHLTVKPFIDFQIKGNASAIISPTVNISSKQYLRDQVTKSAQMLSDTRTLLETMREGYLRTRDLMNVITINYKLVQPNNFSTFYRLALSNNPDQVAFKFLQLRESDTENLPYVFTFLRDFARYSMEVTNRKEPIPVHLFNVDELGYLGYCNGVCNIASPVATSPYYSFPSKDKDQVDTTPTYYHPIDMNHPKIHQIDLLPCDCYECRIYKRMSNVDGKFVPIFRRRHWSYVKDGEIRQFRTSRQRLDLALKDKFARSMRTQLAAYVPEVPLFAV